MSQQPRVFVGLVVGMVTLAVVFSGCDSSDAAREIVLAPEWALPAFVRNGPSPVKEAYRFALANPEMLATIPCHCGCGRVGHTSNLACYIDGVASDGSIVFDQHGFG